MPEPWFDELAEFLRIPSVSADPLHASDVQKAAEWVTEAVRGAGGDCEVVDWDGQPLVIGEIRASSGNGSTRSSSDRRMAALSPPGRSVRPMLPANSTSPVSTVVPTSSAPSGASGRLNMTEPSV